MLHRGLLSLPTVEFLLRNVAMWRSDSLTVINRNPGTQWTGTLWVTAGNAEWVWVGCLVNMVKRQSGCVTQELRVLTYKDQTRLGTNEVTSLNTRLALWEIDGRACQRHAGGFKVSEASLQLFLGNWRFHGMPVCLKPCRSSNIFYGAVKALSTHKHILIHDLLKSQRLFGSKNGGRCQTKGMTSWKNKWNREIQDSGSQASGSCKYVHFIMRNLFYFETCHLQLFQLKKKFVSIVHAIYPFMLCVFWPNSKCILQHGPFLFSRATAHKHASHRKSDFRILQYWKSQSSRNRDRKKKNMEHDPEI